MKKKNILFICDGNILNPIIHSQGLPLLKCLAEKGYIPTFISFENGTDEIIKRKIKREYLNSIIFYEIKFKYLKVIPNWVLYFFWGTVTIIKVIKKENINILHCRSLFPGLIALFIKIFYKKNIKIIYDNRGVFIDEEILKGHWKKNGFRVKLFRKLEKKLLKQSEAHIVVSEFFKKYMIDKNKKEIPNLSKYTYVITNGTKVNDVNINKLKNNDDKIIGVYSGSAASWQNSNEIINLLKLLPESTNNLQFKIISYHSDYFKEIIRNNNIDTNKVTIENLSSNEVWNSLVKCNFGILIRDNNIINNVASPLKFAEYLSAGLPVLVSKGVGDTENIINKYGVGIVIENYSYKESLDKILILLQDKTIYQRCIDVAKKEFDINNCFKKYENIYSKIINE